MKVRLPRHPAAYVADLPEPARLELYDRACFLNGLDLADLIFALELTFTNTGPVATFTVQETLDLDGRLVKVKKRVVLPSRPLSPF